MLRTKSDAPVIQQIEADIGASSLQLPLPLLLCVGLLRIPLCYVAPAWYETLRHLPHKLHTNISLTHCIPTLTRAGMLPSHRLL